MEEIGGKTKFPSEQLVFNHRLPKKVARLAEHISESGDELEMRCKIEGSELPKILEYQNLESQFDAIIEIVKNRQLEDVGIVFRTNKQVEEAQNYFKENGLDVDAKFNNSMDLNFGSTKPKLTTYHSCKGLQYEAVFIPDCTLSGADDRSPLYVAITRSYHLLFVMHSGYLSSFFNDVPSDLYETTLIKKTVRLL
jgi:superfamily I DNA/RNA helicase